MTDFTIANEYILPSQGKVYSQDVNSQIKLRSMTTAEEMKRLNHSERRYKAMSEIIDECLVENIGISSYDLCIPDYQYLLHKLRIVTYGPDYKISTTCKYCGVENHTTLNLEGLNFIPFDEEAYKKYSEFILPVTGKKIKLRMQTPRMLDDIQIKSKEFKRKNPGAIGDPAFLFTLENIIETVDDSVPYQAILESMIRKLPMKDTNHILQSAYKLNNLFGLDSQLLHTCGTCGLDYTSNFRTTSEFFGPTLD